MIDSGIDTSHEDLANLNVERISLLSYSQTESLIHGTTMAGVICASPSNSNGLAGLVPKAKIYDIQVIDDNGYCSTDALIETINMAIQKKLTLLI